MLKLTKTGIGLLTRQYRSVLKKCWMINVGVFALSAALMPNEAEAGVLCYATDGTGTVKYSTDTTCPDGTTYRLMSLDAIYPLTMGDSSVTLGRTAAATGEQSIALGFFAHAAGVYSTALGEETRATGANSTALGTAARAYGKGSSAFGYSTIAGLSSDDTIDSDTRATTASVDRYATAIGSYSTATGLYALAIGNQKSGATTKTTASGQSSIAIGAGAVASSANAVVIGTNSTDGGEDTISIGSTTTQRKIVNLKAGTADTDAVNFKQLTDGLAGKQATLTTAQLNAANSGITSTKVNTYDNTSKYFKANADTTDGPANAYGTGSVAIGSNAIAGVSDTESFATAVGTESSATGDYSSAFGYMSYASGENSNAIGGGSTARGNASLALGAASTNTIWTYDTTHNRWIGGEYSTPTNGTIAEGVFAQATGNGSIALGYAAIAGEYDTSEDKGNRKDGNQEYRRYVTGAIDNALAIGNYSNASAEYAAALGYGATASAINSVAIGKGSIASVANTISVGSGLDADSETYQYRKIVNVADGVNEHDAATKGQLDTALNNYYTKLEFSGKFMKNDNVISSLAVYENNLSSLAVYENNLSSLAVYENNLSSLAVCGASPRQGISTFGVAASISDIALRKGQIAGRSDAQRTSSDDGLLLRTSRDDSLFSLSLKI